MVQSITPRSDLLGVSATQGVQGGGTFGIVSVGLDVPVSLLNGGTGVSAFSAAQLVSLIGALPTTGGVMAGDLTVAGGLVIGSTTTGGNKGNGSINADAIYINNVPVGTGGGLPTTGGTIAGTLVVDGTTVPDPLTVKTNAGVSAKIRFDNDNGVDSGRWRVGCGPGGGFQIYDEYYNAGAGGPVLTSDSANGNVVINHNLNVNENGLVAGDLVVSGTFTPSDCRVKQQIEPWQCGLEAVTRLNPVSFIYNGLGGTLADGKIRIGLDAESAGKVIPEMVGTSASREIGGAPILTISPNTLIFALTNAVKELAARIEALEGIK